MGRERCQGEEGPGLEDPKRGNKQDFEIAQSGNIQTPWRISQRHSGCLSQETSVKGMWELICFVLRTSNHKTKILGWIALVIPTMQHGSYISLMLPGLCGPYIPLRIPGFDLNVCLSCLKYWVGIGCHWEICYSR